MAVRPSAYCSTLSNVRWYAVLCTGVHWPAYCCHPAQRTAVRQPNVLASECPSVKNHYTAPSFSSTSIGIYTYFCTFGIDDTGNAITGLTKLDLRTPGPTPVDMTFNVTLKKESQTSVSATIVPSIDNEPYYLNIQSTAFTDPWADDPEGMMLKLVFSSLPKEYFSLMWVDGGTYELAPTTFTLRKNRNYNLIVFGFNNGPTTQPYMFPFSTYAEDTAVDAIQTAGEEEASSVYSLDGKLVMKHADPEQVQQLPKGVYVINKKKVVVR